MTHSAGRCIFFFKFNQVQTISKLKTSGRGNVYGKTSSQLRGDLSIPDNSSMSLKSETKFTVPSCGHQPTGSCGFLVAFLIGQTCSSWCWTERHYWFSTQRTRRLHHCPMTWPTGYLSPADLCRNAAKRTTKHTKMFSGYSYCTCKKETLI